MSCCCSLPPECCPSCSNFRPGLGSIAFLPINHPPPMMRLEMGEKEKRKFLWALWTKQFGKPPCVYFCNIDRGLDCTAKNCPCELYEVDE